jgi:hypothetical protein
MSKNVFFLKCPNYSPSDEFDGHFRFFIVHQCNVHRHVKMRTSPPHFFIRHKKVPIVVQQQQVSLLPQFPPFSFFHVFPCPKFFVTQKLSHAHIFFQPPFPPLILPSSTPNLFLCARIFAELLLAVAPVPDDDAPPHCPFSQFIPWRSEMWEKVANRAAQRE